MKNFKVNYKTYISKDDAESLVDYSISELIDFSLDDNYHHSKNNKRDLIKLLFEILDRNNLLTKDDILDIISQDDFFIIEKK